MTKYAANTSVSVEKSRAEIEKILSKYGAESFGYKRNPTAAMIEFIAEHRHIRFVLPLPDRNSDEFRLTPAGKRKRTPADQEKAWEQACRQKWRALCLAIKAKLETVESEISTFEKEFLAHIVDPITNRTIGEELIPLIEQRYQGVDYAAPLALPSPEDFD